MIFQTLSSIGLQARLICEATNSSLGKPHAQFCLFTPLQGTAAFNLHPASIQFAPRQHRLKMCEHWHGALRSRVSDSLPSGLSGTEQQPHSATCIYDSLGKNQTICLLNLEVG